MLAHIICPGRPEPVTASGGCGTTSGRGARCTLPGRHSGDHYDAVMDVSWYRIGGVVSQYKGIPVTLPKGSRRTRSPYLTTRARALADATVVGSPPGEPRALAYLHLRQTAKGAAWYIEAADTRRIVWAGMTGEDAAAWARANRYRIVRAPDQREIPALSNDLPTTPKGGKVPSTH